MALPISALVVREDPGPDPIPGSLVSMIEDLRKELEALVVECGLSLDHERVLALSQRLDALVLQLLQAGRKS